MGHSGVPSTTGRSTRLEEHLAIALCNDPNALPLTDSSELRLLDYQVPLKARQSDAAIGKIDLVALSNADRVTVVELKVNTRTSNGDTPLRALLEALSYCAIVEANADAFASEIQQLYGRNAVTTRPDLVVMGPVAYWSVWSREALAAVYELADRLDDAFELRICFLNLGDINVEMGADGKRPEVIGRVSADMLHSTTNQQ